MVSEEQGEAKPWEQPRSVQSYIDETPSWPDGTGTPGVPMTRMQWRIWLLATAGKFFEGLVVFMTGVALPLIVAEFGLGPTEKGIVGAATLAGILVGATALGGLADTFGRKRMFIVEMIIFVVFLVALSLSPSFPWLVVFLFGVGLALGCDYPTAHLVISESIASKDRGKLVLSAFGFQAVGALAGTAIGYLILSNLPEVGAWRWMYATAIIPAVLVIIGRLYIPKSGHWLVERGRVQEAEQAVMTLLERDPRYPKQVRLAGPAVEAKTDERRSSGGYGDLFNKKNRRATVLASLPWFLQDLGTYGIGIFTPTVLAAAIGHQTTHPHNLTAIIHNDILAAKGAALLDVLLIVGIVAAVLLADKVGRIRLQVIGFIGCAIGLGLAALSQLQSAGGAQMALLFLGFMLFNFMTNMGPNAQTYLLAGEVFPTRIRGKGAGFAASFAKIGAVTTAFLFPVLLAEIGTEALLSILVGTSIAGALITWWFRIETAGKNLEEIGR
jgi:MFS family permease